MCGGSFKADVSFLCFILANGRDIKTLRQTYGSLPGARLICLGVFSVDMVL